MSGVATSNQENRFIPLTNLLTNSQWMAMSGSTLLEATSGAAPVLDGANAALVNNLLSGGGFDGETTGWTSSVGASLTLSSEAGGKTGNCLQLLENGADWPYAFQSATTVVGKLYQFNCYVNAGTEATYTVNLGTSAGNDSYGSLPGEAADDWTTTVVSKVFEATTTSTTISLYIGATSGQATTIMYDSVTLYEVTPGYVAADTVAPDGSTKTATLDLHQYWNCASANTYGKGKYLMQATQGAGTAEYWNLGTAIDYRQCQGQPVTMACYVYSVTAADNVKLSIHDGVSEIALSSAFCPADTLTWMEVTGTVAAAATALTPRVLFDGTAGDVAYISPVMFVRGSSIGEGNYQPIPNEQVLSQANIALTGYTATTSAADAIINLEAASAGMIGKGVKAVLVKAYGKDSAAADGVGFDVQSASGVEDGISVDTQVNNIKVQGQGWVKCDASGDIYFDHRGSGAAALTVDVKVIGVQT